MEKLASPVRLGDDEWYGRFRKYVIDASALIALTREGVARIEQLPELLETLHPGEGYSDDPKIIERDRRRLEEAKKSAEAAKEVQQSDFALLHAHSVMGLWGALEAAVEDLVATRLVRHPELFAEPALAKIKLPVSVLAMSRWDRARAIVTALQRESGSDNARGLGQFDKLLRPVGLGGDYTSRLREAFVFAQQYRHLVAHRAGRADEQFMTACPKVETQLGDPVTLSRADFNRVTTAMAVFAGILMNRRRILDGLSPDTRVRDSGTIPSDWWEEDEN